MTLHAVISSSRTTRETMPEAGKPHGLCEECGPHGNQGWVDISIWRRCIVPCIECQNRADGVAYRRAVALINELTAEIKRDNPSTVRIVDYSCGYDDAEREGSWVRTAYATVHYECNMGPVEALEVPTAPAPAWATSVAARFGGRVVTPVGAP
jgi:hypothetical protein